MKPDYKLVAKAKYVHLTADLAAQLWQECYKKYYPPKQLNALIDTLQGADAIEEDIDSDVNYFIVQMGGKPIGYFAWQMENTALHLLHVYLLPEWRGKALGRDILSACERLARSDGRGPHQSPAGAGLLQGAGLPPRRPRPEGCQRHPNGSDPRRKISLIPPHFWYDYDCISDLDGIHLHQAGLRQSVRSKSWVKIIQPANRACTRPSSS